jgi:hypothetical protein
LLKKAICGALIPRTSRGRKCRVSGGKFPQLGRSFSEKEKGSDFEEIT